MSGESSFTSKNLPSTNIDEKSIGWSTSIGRPSFSSSSL
jgi:hypothetical protein